MGAGRQKEIGDRKETGDRPGFPGTRAAPLFFRSERDPSYFFLSIGIPVFVVSMTL